MTETPKKKPFRIFIDDVKIRHTSHWDEDFMSREELDAAYAVPTPAPSPAPPATASDDDEKKP
ncbi:MAG: hypothetical protein LPJ91_06425 [Pseudazoarcus pumilus]|nr:hypothetical protein [Pseudazoarcus pumilus]